MGLTGKQKQLKRKLVNQNTDQKNNLEWAMETQLDGKREKTCYTDIIRRHIIGATRIPEVK